MDWQVTITVELDQVPTDELMDRLVDDLTEHGAAIGGGAANRPTSIGAVMTIVDETTPADAVRAGWGALAYALRGYRIVAWTEAEAITTEAADERLDTPTIPDLVSGVEAAEILGVSRQRVHQLSAGNPRFPRPVAKLASGSIWLRAGVEGFARTWERRPGRPARAS